MQEKRCKRCGRVLPLTDEFWNRNKVHADGYHYSCKACKRNPDILRRWRDMIQRCYNPRCRNYRHYGARGIRVCEEWLGGSAEFERWALENGFSRELSLDRINNDGMYCPENCRWTTRSIQGINMRHANSSGYVGVCKHSSGHGWYGRVKVDGVCFYTGIAQTGAEAAAMRDKFIATHRLPNRLNGVCI